jgi:hypothetical protein
MFSVMQKIELKHREHSTKIGDKALRIEPNITEDCVFYEGGEAIGFFLRRMPEKAVKLAEIADNEFRSDKVPKSRMNRGTEKQAKSRGQEWVSQFSTILGSVAPKPHMKRPYPTRSSVHQVKSAQTFIKAMLLLARESEKLMQEILPEQHQRQKQLFQAVPDQWKFGSLFTSSISNYNISAPYHRDTGNIKGAVNVIITKRRNSRGGNLHVPDYDATIDQCDNSILVYPAWRNVHGVTPIEPTFEDGYRNSLIFYPLKAFANKTE